MAEVAAAAHDKLWSVRKCAGPGLLPKVHHQHTDQRCQCCRRGLNPHVHFLIAGLHAAASGGAGCGVPEVAGSGPAAGSRGGGGSRAAGGGRARGCPSRVRGQVLALAGCQTPVLMYVHMTCCPDALATGGVIAVTAPLHM